MSDTMEPLTNAINQVLESKGVLASLRAQLRQCVFESVDEIGLQKGQVSMIRERTNPRREELLLQEDGRIALSLVYDMLQCCGFVYTAKVFEPESHLGSNHLYTRDEIRECLALPETLDTSDPLIVSMMQALRDSRMAAQLYSDHRREAALSPVKTPQPSGSHVAGNQPVQAGSGSPVEPGSRIPAYSGAAGKLDNPIHAGDGTVGSGSSSPVTYVDSATVGPSICASVVGNGACNAPITVGPEHAMPSPDRAETEHDRSVASSSLPSDGGFDGGLPLPSDSDSDIHTRDRGTSRDDWERIPLAHGHQAPTSGTCQTAGNVLNIDLDAIESAVDSGALAAGSAVSFSPALVPMAPLKQAEPPSPGGPVKPPALPPVGRPQSPAWLGPLPAPRGLAVSGPTRTDPATIRDELLRSGLLSRQHDEDEDDFEDDATPREQSPAAQPFAGHALMDAGDEDDSGDFSRLRPPLQGSFESPDRVRQGWQSRPGGPQGHDRLPGPAPVGSSACAEGSPEPVAPSSSGSAPMGQLLPELSEGSWGDVVISNMDMLSPPPPARSAA